MKDYRDIPIFERADRFADRTALISPEGSYTYRELIDLSRNVASALLEDAGDLNEARVAFITPPGIHYSAVQWGIWRAGGVAVPLNVHSAQPELEFVIENSGASTIVAHPDCAETMRSIADTRGLRFNLSTETLEERQAQLPVTDLNRRAMIVYTSGTTGKPKGVVTTHNNLNFQIQSLVDAWEWSSDDHILSILPLHHVHGIINVLSCALWCGAVCEIAERFDPERVWECFIRNEITLFMAVPTIYVKLIEYWEAADKDRQRKMTIACKKLRLMVSGSSALPPGIFERWRQISGHDILERYGMTEVGMALTNPLRGNRKPGYVGAPFPDVSVRLVDDNRKQVKPGEWGEIQVKGPGVFLEYWNDREATRNAFTEGWFNTGDIAVEESGYYRIIGRRSLEIIKTGGYKVSVIEIEDAIRVHPDVVDCAVVGIKDMEWGERVCAVLVTRKGCSVSLESLRTWAKERLASYKIPSQLYTIDSLPRNSMGKIDRRKLADLVVGSSEKLLLQK